MPNKINEITRTLCVKNSKIDKRGFLRMSTKRVKKNMFSKYDNARKKTKTVPRSIVVFFGSKVKTHPKSLERP
jgi:hypothetical protein